MPEPVNLGASQYEEASDMPARIADGIVGSGVPIDPFGTSKLAPPSINALATSTSSLLAAQCRGVSDPG